MQEPVELARELARIARENGLAEIEYREENTALRLIFEHRPRPAASAPVLAAPLAPAAAAAEAAAPAPAPASTPLGKTVDSPLAGVFYLAPRPGAPPFVEPGKSVSAGDTLCIVEAMKLMNEIAAEGPLKVLRVLAENGQVVEAGQPLFEFEALG